MKTNPEALKDLYIALGGEEAAVADKAQTVDVLNALAAKYEGKADATQIPDAIDNITAVADNIGGGSGSLKYGEVTINVASNFPLPTVEVQTIIDGMFSYVEIERGSSGKMIVPLMVIPDEDMTFMSGASALNSIYQTNMKVTATGGTADLVKAGTMAVLNLQSEPNNTNMTVTLSMAS